MTNPATIVQRVWNYCNVLRDDGDFTHKQNPPARADLERTG